MGCTETRPATSAEKYMREWEAVCSPAKVPVRKADLVLRRYAVGWKLTPDQLARVASDLGVSLQNDKVAQHRHFFRSFRQAGLYSGQEIAVALVLLGEGAKTEKLELLFELFEKQCANSLPAHSVQDMASALLRVAVLKAPLLIPANNLELTSEVGEYVSTLKASLNKASSALAEALLDRRTTLTMEELVVTAENVRMADITTCGGLRDFAISVSLGQRRFRTKSS